MIRHNYAERLGTNPYDANPNGVNDSAKDDANPNEVNLSAKTQPSGQSTTLSFDRHSRNVLPNPAP